MSWLYALLGLEDVGRIAETTDWLWRLAAPWPAWLWALLGAAAVAAAALNFLPHNAMPVRTRIGLAALRIAGVALIAIMLGRLELQMRVERLEPPRIAVLFDASGSMGVSDVDGDTRWSAAKRFAKKRLKPLSDRAKLVRYSFNWKLAPGMRPVGERAKGPDGPTHLIGSLERVLRRERGLAGVVVLTDGHDTTGNRGDLVAPMFQSRGVPVYPVVFGSTEMPPTARVSITSGAEYLRLGNQMRLSARLSAQGLDTQRVTVQLRRKGEKEPISQRRNVKLGKKPTRVSFVIEPKKPGERVYRIVARGVDESATEKTLAAEHRVEVIDQPIRVLYVDVPRAERKILGHWLRRDKVIEAGIVTRLPKGGWYGQGSLQHEQVGAGIPGEATALFQYDVIILGDIARSYFRQEQGGATKLLRLAEFVRERGGGLITLGGRHVYAAGDYRGTPLEAILPFELELTDDPQIGGEFALSPTPTGLAHPIMQLEWGHEANRRAWLEMPKLDGSNRVTGVKAGATVLARRHLGEEGEKGAMPVMAVQNVGKGRVLSLAVDTTWRWEMQRPAEGTDYFRRFWGNAIRALAPDPRTGPGKPHVQRHRSDAPVGERLRLSTRLVNQAYEPIRRADLKVRVESPSGEIHHIYPRDSRGEPGLYEYEVALDERGIWKVTTVHNGQSDTERIRAGQTRGELEDPRARPAAMGRFAKRTGGRRVKRSDPELASALDLDRRRVVETRTIAFWNLPLLMVALIGLVCLDCLIRKRRGMV